MASSRKSTSSKSYQEGPRKKLLRQRDHVEAQPTVENDASAQKRRVTSKSNVASKSKATNDSSKTPKVDASKAKLTKKKMTTEERERSDKKPFSKEHTPPDIHSPAPSVSSSVASTSQGAEKTGVSSIAGKSSESSVISSSSAVSAKGLPGDPTSTSCNVGASSSTLKKSSASVAKSTSGATMKKSSRMSQSESKKDSSRERKMGVVSCGPIHGSKSEQKATSKTKNAKVIPGDSTTGNLSSTAPVSNTSEAKVSVVKKSCSTEPKNEASKPPSGLSTGSSKDSNNTTSSERSFYIPDHSSNVRLKRLIQEQAFDECEEDSISTSELNTSLSFSLTPPELKKK